MRQVTHWIKRIASQYPLLFDDFRNFYVHKESEKSASIRAMMIMSVLAMANIADFASLVGLVFYHHLFTPRSQGNMFLFSLVALVISYTFHHWLLKAHLQVAPTKSSTSAHMSGRAKAYLVFTAALFIVQLTAIVINVLVNKR